MTKQPTCKTCKFWGERGRGSKEPFANRCICWQSSNYGTFTDESYTCDKYQSKDKQREMRLE